MFCFAWLMVLICWVFPRLLARVFDTSSSLRSLMPDGLITLGPTRFLKTSNLQLGFQKPLVRTPDPLQAVSDPGRGASGLRRRLWSSAYGNPMAWEGTVLEGCLGQHFSRGCLMHPSVWKRKCRQKGVEESIDVFGGQLYPSWRSLWLGIVTGGGLLVLWWFLCHL